MTGVVVHIVLSAFFGVVFGMLAWLVPRMWASSRPMLAIASAYGVGLWVVNFYVIAPWADWVWFRDESMPLVQFLAHTFFFGTVFGIYLDMVVGRRPKVAGRRTPTETLDSMRKAG